MPKNDNPHSLRLIEALQGAFGAERADAFALENPLSKAADVEKKHRWACEVCAALEASSSPDEAARIRRACRCGDGKSMAQEIMKCIKKAGSLAEGCTLFSQQNRYAFLEYVSENELIFGYHACVCSCIKRAEGTVPALWCECSAEYAEAMFSQVFGEDVCVTLLDSVKSGAERCTLRVEW